MAKFVEKMKKLLIERTSLIAIEKPTLLESIQNNDGRLILKNVLIQRADAPNKNGRVYPKRVLERSINEHMSMVKAKMAYGECDHPSGDEANLVSVKNIAQAIMDIKWKNDEVYADIEILKTPSGNIVREILLAGYRIGQSSRGMGSVQPLKESGEQELVEVQDDFELISACDIVSNPSTHYAEMAITENYDRKLIHTENNDSIDLLLQEILCSMTNVCCLIHK